MDTKPLVSIVIPSKNQGQFLQNTLDSVLNQNYRPIEIIIIDSASTDNTQEILKNYGKKPEIQWVSELDNGHADGINKGFSLAKGEIVAWLNSDDIYYSKDVIQTVVSHFEANKSHDVVYGHAAIISKNNLLLRFFFVPPYNANRITRRNLIVQPTVFMRKKIVQAEKLTVGQIGLDYDYWLRLIVKQYSFHRINKILACDRHYPERLSFKKKDIIEQQINNTKINLGIQNTYHSLIMYPVDRFAQAKCRLIGLMHIIKLLLDYNENFAVPIFVDSYLNLIVRQTIKSIGSDFEI